ncbi:AMP-activated serine/threonine-protein kinase regulatory subunit [Savitreella phatthalungensis]
MSATQAAQDEALAALRNFMKKRTCYDVLPVSFRLIVLDTSLLVKKALTLLIQNGIVSCPLWNSEKSTFAGLLTAFDFINVIQYYYQYSSYPDAVAQIENFRLDGLREVERKVGAIPPETLSISPEANLYEACLAIHRAKARRIPLIDKDDETGNDMLVSVLTQYRILKWLAINCEHTMRLHMPISELPIGTYGPDLAHATMDSPVSDMIHLMSRRKIAAVPVVDPQGVCLNIFEAVDVLTLIQDGAWHDLELTVGEALLRRPDDFAGVITCTVNDTLEAVFDAVRRDRVHRLVIVEPGTNLLKGMLSLSDILGYILR